MSSPHTAPNEDALEHLDGEAQVRQTLAFQVVGETVVFACGDRPLDSSEWDEYLAELTRTLRVEPQLRSLVYAHSAQPTPIQRGKLNAVLNQAASRGARPQSAVLTPSPLVRGVITALRWFHRETFRTFAPEDLDQALLFLRLDSRKAPEVKRALHGLQRALGLEPVG